MTAPQTSKTYGDRNLTAQQISEWPASQQQEYVERHMSPEDRYDYLQANVADQSGNLRAEVEPMVNAQQQAGQYGRQIMQQATNSETQYVSGLSPSDINYQATDHATLQGYVDNGLSAGQIGTMSNGYHDMAGSFDRIANAFSEAVNKSQSKWQGNAADSARGFFTGLQQWADGNAQNARLASGVTYQQSTAAQMVKNSMPAPIPFSWSDEMKNWFSNPFTVGDSIRASVQKAQQSQEAHDRAAQVMSTYDSTLYSAASKQPVFAEPPKFEPLGVVAKGEISGSVGGIHASGYASPMGGTGGGGAGSVSGAMGGLGSPLSPGAKTGSSPTSTKAQGYQSYPGLSPATPSSDNASDPPNPLAGIPPMAPMTGCPAGDDSQGYSSKIGRGGGFGPGGGSGGAGSAARGGSAASSATGEGARMGLRAGGAGAVEAAGATGGGARGATGRTETSGMGHGEGEAEDELHQRPSWLVEADPNELFGTSERTAPPIIGE